MFVRKKTYEALRSEILKLYAEIARLHELEERTTKVGVQAIQIRNELEKELLELKDKHKEVLQIVESIFNYAKEKIALLENQNVPNADTGR